MSTAVPVALWWKPPFAEPESKMPASLALLLTLGSHLTPAPHAPFLDARQGLLAAEWAFVRHAEREGIRASFLAAFHPEAVMFRPGPVNGPEIYAKRQETGAVLRWHPALAEVSSSGDLGFTTGPSRFQVAPNAPTVHHGWFVSLWVRERGGPWKLRLDLGISNPEPAAAIPALPEPKGLPTPLPAKIAPAPCPALLEADRAFARQAAERGLVPAYRAQLEDQARLLLEGAHPHLGWEAVRKALETGTGGASVTWETTTALASHAQDLGCTWGTLTRRAPGSEKATRANVVRMWRRSDPRAPWKVVLEIQTPRPEKE